MVTIHSGVPYGPENCVQSRQFENKGLTNGLPDDLFERGLNLSVRVARTSELQFACNLTEGLATDAQLQCPGTPFGKLDPVVPCSHLLLTSDRIPEFRVEWFGQSCDGITDSTWQL